uniref:HIT domain-containing protein n=1 Tax=Oreochromis aureus TaxID=47969 RepID=A0AAZ1XBB5_OREAU
MEDTATNWSNSDENDVETCIFCLIANKKDENTKIIKEDDELVCFRDKKPGATHHYLVIPRMHISNCKTLKMDNIPLVERMEQMGRHILEKNKVCSLDDVRLGFHLPPFSSVPHLHLHALAPASKMNLKSQLRYGQQSYWFITVSQGWIEPRKIIKVVTGYF